MYALTRLAQAKIQVLTTSSRIVTILLKSFLKILRTLHMELFWYFVSRIPNPDYIYSQNYILCFQAALLYTSAKGERRIRVHTLCLPTSASVSDIINSADQQAVLGMLVKFGKYFKFQHWSNFSASV
jgi:hypothetical protein